VVWQTKRLAILRAVDTYARGHVRISLAREQAQIGKSANDPGGLAATEAYLDSLAESGECPHLAAFGATSLLRNEYEEPVFETGLNWLLTGFAAEVGAAAARDGSPV
jgi:hypothetical protein